MRPNFVACHLTLIAFLWATLAPFLRAAALSEGYLSDASKSQLAESIAGKSAGGFDPHHLVGDELGIKERGAEYISGYYRGAVLMPVRIWGAVKQSGLHHVPTGSDLLQLISLAGGPSANAELDNIKIKRTTTENSTVLNIDLENSLEVENESLLKLEPDDIVIVPEAKPLVSTDTLAVIGVVSSVVGIIASSVIIANQVQD